MFPTTPELRAQIRLCVALALTVCIGVAGANVATASFTDVPAENQFAESVTRVQESGIATGFADGSFRPREPINRQQAAAWLDRSVTRVGLDQVADGPTTLNAANPTAVVVEVEMTSPAAPIGRGWVTIQGGVGAVSVDPASTCPCPVDLFVYDENDEVIGRSVVSVAFDPSGREISVSPIFGVDPINGGEAHTYRVVASLVDLADEVTIGGTGYSSFAPMVDGEPGTHIESSPGSDPVESMVP